MDSENEGRIFIRNLSGTAGNARLKADRFEAGFLFFRGVGTSDRGMIHRNREAVPRRIAPPNV